MIIFWIAFIWIIVWLVSQSGNKKENALKILKERYAKGELSRKQYGEMKKDIKD